MTKPCAVLACTASILLLVGCSDIASPRTSYNLTGVWFGTLQLGCVGHCFSQPEISFTLFQQSAEIEGFYRCWMGRGDCPDPDFGGKVRIPDTQSTQLLIRVLMYDGSRCVFQGSRR